MRPAQYRIVVPGHLSDRFATTFDGMATEPGPRRDGARRSGPRPSSRRFEECASLKTRTFRITVDVTEPRARREARSLPFFALVDEPTVDAARVEDARWRSASTSLDRLEQREAARCVGETIAALPAQQRRVVTLGDLRRLPSTEVWDEFCLTPGNQRVLLRRAEAKLCAAPERLQRDDGTARLVPASPPTSASSAGGRRA
jgi:DNA-directed RNA polymerase specialized sigma24 family protein